MGKNRGSFTLFLCRVSSFINGPSAMEASTSIHRHKVLSQGACHVHRNASKHVNRLVFDVGLGFKCSSCLCDISSRTSLVSRRNFSLEAKDEEECLPWRSGESKTIGKVCEILCKSRWCEETERELKCYLSSMNAHVVIKAIKTVQIEVAIQFFNWLKTQGFFHDFRTYHAFIDALGESRKFALMRDQFDEVRHSGCNIRSMLYRDVMYWSACGGDFDGVISYWEDAKNDEIKPSASLWTSVIDIYAKAKRFDEAIKHFSEMIDAGLDPNPRTISIFIDHLVDFGKLDDADAIVEHMIKIDMFPNMISYASLMVAHAKLSNVMMLKKFSKHLRFVCDRPGYPFCNAIRRIYEECGEKQALLFGKEVWPELSEDKLMEKVASGHLSREGSEVYGASGKNLSGRDLGGLNPSHLHMEKILKTWNPLTVLALKQAKIKWTHETIYEVLSRRIQKPIIAWRFFHWLTLEQGVKHDLFNQITMLRILSRNGMFPPLRSLLIEMREEGSKPSRITFNFIIKDFSIAKNAGAALWVFNYMKDSISEPPNQETFTALMDAYSLAKWHEKAIFLLENMLQEGYVLEASSCTLFMDMLRLAGKFDEIHCVFHSYIDCGGNPDAQCFTSLIKTYSHSGNTMSAMQIFTSMREAGIMPLPETLWTMAWVYLQIGDLEKFHDCMKPPKDRLSQQQRLQFIRRESFVAIHDILVKGLIQGAKLLSALSC